MDDERMVLPPELAKKLIEILEDQSVQVRFRPGLGGQIDLSWAQQIITRLHDENPKLFGKFVSDLITEYRLNGGRGARNV